MYSIFYQYSFLLPQHFSGRADAHGIFYLNFTPAAKNMKRLLKLIQITNIVKVFCCSFAADSHSWKWKKKKKWVRDCERWLVIPPAPKNYHHAKLSKTTILIFWFPFPPFFSQVIYVDHWIARNVNFVYWKMLLRPFVFQRRSCIKTGKHFTPAKFHLFTLPHATTPAFKNHCPTHFTTLKKTDCIPFVPVCSRMIRYRF